MRTHIPSKARNNRDDQFDLFATAGAPISSGVKIKPASPQPAAKEARSTPPGAVMRAITLADLPDYPQLDQDLVDQSIAALPPHLMWFTYAAIREAFGVSRATVARKVKKGLVPGIRFKGTSVVEDGPVRRFDRSQLRWLLLAVRSST